MNIYIASANSGCNVLQSPCVCVPAQKPRFLVVWRLLVKERIANIGIPLGLSVFCRFNIFLGFSVFAKQPTVHNGGVCRGRCVAVGVSDSFGIGATIGTHREIYCLPYLELLHLPDNPLPNFLFLSQGLFG